MKEGECPFCHLLHDPEKSDCHTHDGTRSILLRRKGPVDKKEEERVLESEWRYSNGFLCCGTLRIAQADFDTDPDQKFVTAVFKQIVDDLNAHLVEKPEPTSDPHAAIQKALEAALELKEPHPEPTRVLQKGDQNLLMSIPRLRVLIENAHRLLGRKYKQSPLWSIVSDLTGHGSTVSSEICILAGLNPGQRCSVKKLETIQESEADSVGHGNTAGADQVNKIQSSAAALEGQA